MTMENEEISMTAGRFRAIVGDVRKEILRRLAPGKSVIDELLAERRDEAGHD